MTDNTAGNQRRPCSSQTAAILRSTELPGILATLIFALVHVAAIAQRPVASTALNLKIRDTTGAVVPGASIEIDASARNTHVRTQSDAVGQFSSGPIVVGSDALAMSNAVLTRTLKAPAEPHLPIEVKVVVVSMFEIGADTGDVPGEYQYWVERQHLTRILPFPQGYHDLRLNPETGVLGLLTGIGTARAAASVMALGLDPRFDLTHTYWLVAGIAGIDPHVGSLGSAVWADYIVDGDLSHEIDAREIPPTWTTGHVPLRKSTPYEQPRTDDNGLAYHLNPTLVTWAYNLTRNTRLPDTPEIADRRKAFLPEDPASPAHRPPFVLRGDILSASNFWHGKLMSRWAEDWVAYQTDGKGHYAACGMEDTGTLESLTRLSRAGKIDINRVLVLRTASNYDQQRQGTTATESLAETKITKYGAFLPSLDSA